MRDTVTVIQALGTTFKYSSIAFWVNYVTIPIFFCWLGYRLKDYLYKIEIARLQNSENKLEEEVATLSKRLEQTKLEKARGESDNINLEAEMEKMRKGEKDKRRV